MSGIGLFKELEQAGVYQGFIAGVIAANPEIAEKLVAEMFPMPPEDQVVIVRAIVPVVSPFPSATTAIWLFWLRTT